MRTLTLFALLYARCAFSQTGFCRIIIVVHGLRTRLTFVAAQLPRLTSDYDPAGKDPIQNSSNGGVAVPTAAPNNATITSSVCTGCLLKALNPYTIPDPTTFSDSNHTTVVTTATVIRSTTFFEPSTPVASEVNYYTKTIQTTLVVPNNDTVFHTLSTSVYTYSGVTL